MTIAKKKERIAVLLPLNSIGFAGVMGLATKIRLQLHVVVLAIILWVSVSNYKDRKT